MLTCLCENGGDKVSFLREVYCEGAVMGVCVGGLYRQTDRRQTLKNDRCGDIGTDKRIT